MSVKSSIISSKLYNKVWGTNVRCYFFLLQTKQNHTDMNIKTIAVDSCDKNKESIWRDQLLLFNIGISLGAYKYKHIYLDMKANDNSKMNCNLSKMKSISQLFWKFQFIILIVDKKWFMIPDCIMFLQNKLFLNATNGIKIIWQTHQFLQTNMNSEKDNKNIIT